jgi:OOP family OmpA-OmpF porin
MMIKRKFSACTAIVLALPLSGCGVLASNGINYSSYPIPSLPAPPAPAPLPPPPAPPCQMPESGQPISLAGCKTGDTLVLHGVNFEFNKSALTLNAKALLDQVAGALAARPDIKVEIDGHTDGKGTDRYNQKLSESRANSVKSYLIDHGIAADRLSAKGFGKSMPIADNATDAGREQNRRVELKVIESAAPPLPPPAAVTPAPAMDHAAVVVLEPVPSFLQEPGAGLPTSIGVLSTVPRPVEAGPTAVTSQRALPPGYTGKQASLVGYPGSSAPPAPVAAPAEPAMSAAPAAESMPVASSPAAVMANGNTVAISNFSFVPETLLVSPGTTVTWTNQDQVIHTVKFPDREHTIANGQSFSRTFDKPGEYVYQCGIHTSMKGKVVVK